jgi:geranylgeranyl pyrophosphate synthase
VAARGAMPERLVPAADKAAAAPAEATVEEIDLDALLADSRPAVGPPPPWLKEGWYHAYLLLAQAMGYLPHYKGTGITEALIRASAEMCLGELFQLKVRCEPAKQTRKNYFLQIRRKTAGLLGASCFTGGIAGGLLDAQDEMLRAYGENLGIAFQLCDDLLDFTEQPEFGKKPGQDLLNGIFTLPVLYLLEEGVPSAVISMLMKKDKTERDIIYLIDFVRGSKALGLTKTLIRQKTAEAVNALGGFPDSAEKAALTELALRLSDRHV